MRHAYLILSLLCFAQFSFSQQLTIWSGLADANWQNAQNWTNGIPATGKNAVVPAFVLTGYFPEITQPLIADFDVSNYGQIRVLAPATWLREFNNLTGMVVNRSEFRVAGHFANRAVFQNGCPTCDSTGIGLTILAGGSFENFSTVVNKAKFVIARCGRVYFDSPTKTSLGGDIRLLGVAYILQGDVTFSVGSGTVLFNRTDVPLPSVSVHDVVLQLDANGQATLTVDMADGGTSADYCTLTRSVSQANFTCADVGTHVLTFTATDGFGRVSTQTFNVTVLSSDFCLPCQNVLNGGLIAASDFTCAQVVSNYVFNSQLPSGGVGPMQFQWKKTTTDPALQPNSFALISGEEGENLDAGPLAQTTWFRRFARRNNCADFTAASNIVKITPIGAVEVTIAHPDCATATGSIALANLPTGFSSRLDNGTWTLDQTAYQNVAPGLHTLSIKLGTSSRSANFTVNNLPSKMVLLVVGSTTLNAGDLWVKNRLQGMGLTVSVKDDDLVTTADATGKNLIVVSSTTMSTTIGTKLTNVAVPLINYEPYFMDELKMTGLVADTDNGSSASAQINVIAPTHPIAGGLSGNAAVYTASTTQTWGIPAATATKIAWAGGSNSRAAIFAYESGAVMFGMNAPARRVGFFLHDATAPSLTASGRLLFDNAVKWSLDCQSLPNLGAVAAQNALTFNVSRKNFDVDLRWISNTAATNDYFIVERSADGHDFHPIQKVDGRGAKGEILYFNERDENPLPGDNFYRLRLISLDGKTSFSNTQTVRFEPLANFEIFPNPVRETFFINLKDFAAQETLLRLFDARGQLVQTWTVVPGDEPLELRADASLANGVFFLNVNAPGRRSAFKKIVFEKGD